MTKRFIFAAIILLFNPTVKAQNYRYIDSIRKMIPLKNDNDTIKTKMMTGLAFEYSYVSLDSGLVIAKNALALAEKQNYKRGKAEVLNVIGTIYHDKGDYKMAIECYTKARKIAEQLNSKKILSVIYANESTTHGVLKDYQNCKHYLFESMRLIKELNTPERLAPAYLNLGSLYLNTNMIDSALYYFDLALASPYKNKSFSAILYASKALCYRYQGQYDLAEKECKEAIAIAKEIKSDYYYYEYLNELGIIYLSSDRLKEAEPLLLQALDYAKKSSLKKMEISGNLHLYELYSEKNIHEKALRYHERYTELNDSINNAETNKIARELEKKYEDEKKKTQIEKLNLEKTASETENERKGQLLVFAIIGCALILVALGFAIYAFINKRKANIELQTLHKEVSIQKNELFDKNKNITDSITYAQRIQKALLTSHQYINESVPDFFIVNKPKDIVSGDFYWAQRSGKDFYFMLADCTGHGVPGAFMSLLGISYLNELVIGRSLKDTNTIVDQLRSEIINALNDKDDHTYQIKDGMDAVFCKFNFEKLHLEYTAANNKIVIVRNNSVVDLKGDSMPVGRSPKDHVPFTKQEFTLQKNDMIYMFTDGYPDQFGGPRARPDEHPFGRGKKLKEKHLKELLIKFSGLSIQDQQKKLAAYFEEWKGGLEQIDDVCLVGIKI